MQPIKPQRVFLNCPNWHFFPKLSPSYMCFLRNYGSSHRKLLDHVRVKFKYQRLRSQTFDYICTLTLFKDYTAGSLINHLPFITQI